MNHWRVVHNKKRSFDVYVGRPSKWGNPFTTDYTKAKEGFLVGTREEAVENYRMWVDLPEQRKLREQIKTALKDAILGCWCEDKICHASVQAELADRDNGIPIIDIDITDIEESHERIMVPAIFERIKDHQFSKDQVKIIHQFSPYSTDVLYKIIKHLKMNTVIQKIFTETNKRNGVILQKTLY